MLYLFLLIIVIALILNLPQVKGIIGEGWVRYYLSKLDSDVYMVMHDILLPTEDGKTSQIDHLIISPYGIFVIETKNYRGWIFGDEKNKYWTQVIYNRKEKFQNPIYQNYGHIKVLEALLGEKISPYIFSVICFNSRATLKKINVNSNHIRVIYDNKIARVIQEYKQRVFSYGHQLEIEKIIISHMITEKGAKKEHVKQIRSTLKQKKALIHSNICPKCKGELIQRKGRNGFFTGCSNFPKCRFVTQAGK
ncbi:NERD domain-containing protein [Cytobacillus sp. FJAT-54145]|uniref:NERD domain-containing protein n=1 Tax=Cytobacillus spartinae TaxID=3299023 RepID=A0ABW6KBS8_9BACI